MRAIIYPTRDQSNDLINQPGIFTLFFTDKKTDVMNVNIQTVHFDADTKLVSYIEKKLAKLNQFHERITKVDVYLKLDNVVHNIKDKIAEIKVQIPRHEFFVKQSSKSFEESFDTALDSVIAQIKRKKDRLAA
jgi:putative sigma-54 modulation protein